LNWVRDAGAEECIASHELAQSIERALGPIFVPPSDATFLIEGRVSRDSGWHVRIAVSDRDGRLSGQRELRSASETCRALDAKIALVIELAIDPEVANEGLPAELLELADGNGAEAAAELLTNLQSEQPPATVPQPARLERTVVAIVPEAERTNGAMGSEPTISRDPTWVFAAAPTFALATGVLPELAPSMGIALALQPARNYSLGLDVRLPLAQQLEIEARLANPGSVRLQNLATNVEGCLVPVRPGHLRWDVCLGAGVTVRWLDVEGLAQFDEGAGLFLGGTVSTQLWLPELGPFTPLVGVRAMVPASRDRLSYRDSAIGENRRLFTSGHAQLWAHAGLALRF
jgi:hypothetical protein